MRDRVDELIAGIPEELDDRGVHTIGVAKRIAVLSQRLHAVVDTVLDPLGLTYAEFEILAALRRSEHRRTPQTPSLLAHELSLTSGGMSNALRRLASEELILRTPHAHDARSTQIQLSEKGQQRAASAVALASRAQLRALQDVPVEDLAELSDALRPLVIATSPTHFE